MSGDSLGDRMKAYEAVTNPRLTQNMPVIIRVDGKAFHTFTRKCEKPFDLVIRACMVEAMQRVADQMQGFKIAYHQSDEVTFLITDYDTLQTDGWMGYKLNKLTSITASMFTAFFNAALPSNVGGKTAFFDARAFVIPEADAPNAFIWREKDWKRNSVQMLSRYHFSHKQLHKKSVPDCLDMLWDIGVSWGDISPCWKFGTFYSKTKGMESTYLDYEDIKERIWINETL